MKFKVIARLKKNIIPIGEWFRVSRSNKIDIWIF